MLVKELTAQQKRDKVTQDKYDNLPYTKRVELDELAENLVRGYKKKHRSYFGRLSAIELIFALGNVLERAT